MKEGHRYGIGIYINKILHGPTVFLREEANGPNGEKYASAASKLFGLNGLEDRDKAIRND